jgi:SAM-dependent methyltransferase
MPSLVCNRATGRRALPRPLMEYVSERNRRVYERRSTASYWTTELSPAEQSILARYAPDIDGKDVLDLGVGAGRTTGFLATRARRYLGIDYSSRMVGVCRQRFPAAEIRHGDARDLGWIAGESFDFVLFSFNGIDNVDHQGRMRALGEVYRVLRPGGLFAFSSHNLDAAGSAFASRLLQSQTASNLSRLINPVRVAAAACRLVRRLHNFARNRGKEIRGDGYAILNDEALEFALLQYYVTEREQIRQLKEVGFVGQVDVQADDVGASYSLYYVTRKPGKP